MPAPIQFNPPLLVSGTNGGKKRASDISQATAWLQPELLVFNSPRGWNGSWALRAPSSEDLSPRSLHMRVLPQYQYHCFHFQVSLFG